MREFILQLNSFLDPLRAVRIGPFSAVDLLGTYVIIFLAAPYLSRLAAKIGLHVTRLEWLSLALPAALVAHLWFGIDTPFTQMFSQGGDMWPKVLIVLMVLFGLKGAIGSILKKFR